MIEAFNIDDAYSMLGRLTDDRERSAVIAIHMCFLDCYDIFAKEPGIEPETPLDLLALWRAAIAAFADPLDENGLQNSGANGRVINRDRALRRVDSITEKQILFHTRRYVEAAINFSNESSFDQDLYFFVDIFLETLQRSTPERILSGVISQESRRAEDPDYW